MKIEILFVCKGNICRSPSAEGIMKAYVNKHKLNDKIRCDSAGIINYHSGENADERMQKYANKLGYKLTSISRQITKDDFNKFDYIIVMDDENMNDIQHFKPKTYKAKIMQMAHFCKKHDIGYVPDPYYGGSKGFELVIDLLEDACKGLLNYIQQEHNNI